MNSRIKKLRDEFMSVRPTLSAERMDLATKAYGKFAGEPTYYFRAHVFEYVLDHKKIVIRDGELLAGNLSEYVRSALVFPEYSSGNIWLKDTIPNIDKRPFDPFDCSAEDKVTILAHLDYWDGKSTEDILDKYIPARLKEYKEDGFFQYNHNGTCSSAVTPNFERIFSQGYRGMIETCQKKIDEMRSDWIDVEKQHRIDYWNATIIALEAAIRYSQRHALVCENMARDEVDINRKNELLELAEICRKVPENPPESFYEAIQFQWFSHCLYSIEALSFATSLGRFDINMWPYYSQDLERGLITREKAIELMQSLFLKVSSLQYLTDDYGSQADTGYPMWQVINIGGIDKQGNQVVNDLTEMVLEATEDLKIVQPSVALKINDGLPDKIFDRAAKMVQNGMANPAFFGNETSMKTVMAKGGSEEQARDWIIIGCIEPHPGGGGTCGNPTAGPINLGKIIEITLRNGVDPLTGKLMGLQTGNPEDFTCFEDFVDAVKKQYDYIWDLHARSVNITLGVQGTHLPVIFQSSVLDGCIERGMSVQEGGVNLPYTNIFLVGPSTLVDSLIAIKYAVFKDKIVSMRELVDILNANYEGNERIRQYLLNVPPKFGNDIPEVDDLINGILADACDRINAIPDGRGQRGKFSAGCQSQSHNVASGLNVSATPDGRKAFAPLSDNASPHQGRDISGPTASANSVASLPNEHMHAGNLYNLRFDPSGVAGEKGIETIKNVVRGFCDNGGQHIQINVVDDEMLIAAQENPEEHRDLMVRVAGYLAYFTELEKTVQDAFIQRTAHLKK